MTPSLLASSSSSSSSFDDDGNDCNDDNHEQRHAAHEASALSSTLIQQQSSKNNGMSHNNNNNNMMKDKKKSARPLSEQQQQQPHPTFLSSMQLLEMVQANHHQHGRRPLDNDREEEKEYISQHRKQCHSILKDCLRYNEWDVVMSTLNYMTDQKLIQRRSTFRTCLYKATTCTSHHHHDPQQQQTPSQKSRKYNRNNKNNNNKHHYDETSGGGGTTTTTTTIRSMTNYDQELSVNLNAALQIIQLQLLAGWPPDATDISLIVFALCRSNNNHNHNNRNGRYNNNNSSNHKYLNNRSSCSRNSSNNNNYNDKGNRHRLMDGSNGSGNNGGSWEKAWNFVQHYQKTTPQLPIQIYDAILTCLVQQKQWQSAIRILHYLEQEQKQEQQDDNEQQSSNCPAPAISTYRLVVECCVKAQQVDAAVQILTLAIQRYKNKRNHKMNNMNHTENHNNNNQQQQHQQDSVVAILPSMYSFELVICFLCDKGRWRQALHLFNLMEELAMMQHQQQQNEQQQQRPTIQMANAVLIAMSRAGEVAQAKHLLHRLMRNNNNNNKYKQQQSSYHSSSSYWSLQPNIISYNALISVCANTSGRWKEAIQIYDWLVRTPGVQPDICTYTNIIRAYGKGQQIRQAMTLFQVVQDRKIPCDVHIYTALIQAYATATTTSSSSSLSSSSSSSRRSNNNNYNNNNNANHVVDDPMNPPYWRKALDLLDEMIKLSSSSNSNSSDGSSPSSSSLVRLRPNAVTYNAAISACGNNLQWEKALELLQQMKQEPNCILPSKLIYNNVLTAMARASKQQIIITRSYHNDDDDEIHKKKNNKKGNSIIWTHAKQLLHEMDEAGIEKDGFTYSAALTCCQDHWEDALALIDTMQQQQQKQQGVSSNYNIQTRRRRGGGVKTRTGAATTTISIQPNKMAYTAAITSCGKAGQAQAALDLFRNITMPITTTRVISSIILIVGQPAPDHYSRSCHVQCLVFGLEEQ